MTNEFLNKMAVVCDQKMLLLIYIHQSLYNFIFTLALDALGKFAEYDKKLTDMDLSDVALTENGHLKVVECLIKHGASVNATGSDGWSALHGASENGCLEIVKYLLKNDANVNAKDSRDITPLHRYGFT